MLRPRLLAWMLVASSGAALWAQQSEVSITTPPQNKYTYWFLKPFHMEKRTVPAIRLSNSPRLEQLVRSGNLYLSAQDVIALALENNLDIAVQRYGPFLARESLRRALCGLGGRRRGHASVPLTLLPAARASFQGAFSTNSSMRSPLPPKKRPTRRVGSASSMSTPKPAL